MSASRLYLIMGLTFIGLTGAFYVDAALGPGLERQGDGHVWLSKLVVFLPFFPWLMAFGALGCVLGLIQQSVALPDRLKQLGALAFGLGVVAYAFLRYWNAWQGSRTPSGSSENLVTWPVFLGGVFLLLSLLLNFLGLFRPANDVGASERFPHQQGERARVHRVARKIYLAGGLGLVMGTILFVWYGSWPWEGPRVIGLDTFFVTMVTYPAVLGLGVAGMSLGWLQDQVAIREGIDWALGGAYFVGVGFLLRGLYMGVGVPDNHLLVGWSVSLAIGSLLVISAILANLVGVWLYHRRPKVA